jgi:hypothetical protein
MVLKGTLHDFAKKNLLFWHNQGAFSQYSCYLCNLRIGPKLDCFITSSWKGLPVPNLRLFGPVRLPVVNTPPELEEF